MHKESYFGPLMLSTFCALKGLVLAILTSNTPTQSHKMS